MWKVNQGSAVGRIDACSKTGLFFKHNGLVFRSTSSDFAQGSTVYASISGVDPKGTIGEELLEQCQRALSKRSNVMVNYEQYLFGFPCQGAVSEPIYITRIEPIVEGQIKL